MRTSITPLLLLTLQASLAVAQTAPAKDPVPPAPAAKSAAPAPAQTAKDAAPAKPAAATEPKAPAAKPAEPVSGTAPEGEVQKVEVLAERPTNRIDRQVYDLKSDISTTNASAADALNNVPSVQVDPDGKVSLRGNQNVTILLDGKPSAMLQGENRGAALNAMPADFIESIEVVNNPGAEFGNDGGGGPILNMISRRNRRPGGFGALTGNYGSAGRYNTGVSGSYSEGLASIDTFVNYRRDGRDSTSTVHRERIDPILGLVSPSEQDSSSKGLNGNFNFHTALRYNVGTADRMGGSIGYQHGGRDSSSLTHYRDYGPDGKLIGESLRTNESGGQSRNANVSAFYEHKFDANNATLKFDMRVSDSSNPNESRAHRIYSLSPFPRLDEFTNQYRSPDTRISDFTADYLTDVTDGTITAGIKLIDTKQDFSTRYMTKDPVSGVMQSDPRFSNDFSVDEKLLAAYGTYERKLNEKWSLKGGARVERTEFDIEQITSHISAVNSYTNVMPSAFLSYKVDKDTTWRLAYSHRLQRPNANDLNPYVVYQSPTDRSSGNPMLKPSKSDSLELSYDTNWAGIKSDLRLFMRNQDDVITQRQVIIKDELGQDILLTTRENYGTNKSQGVEFVFNGKPVPSVTLNVSGNVRRAEQTQFAGIGLPATLSNTSLSGRTRINYQMTPDDQFQLAIMGQGKQLWGQGFREPNWTANLTYTRKFTPLLTMIINATDIFSSNRNESQTNSDRLRQTSITRYDGAVIYVGFRYQIGGVTGNNRQQTRREGDPRPEGQRQGGQRPEGPRNEQ
jgi:outer membrane receptor protein involved in Fe transport